jgi:hypothetical protein
MKKRLLVACEFSGAVRDAFAELGHEAWSCDLLPTEKPGNHIQGDVIEHLDDGWDMMIAHPPCTYLCSSGMHWTIRGKRDTKLTEDSLEFVGRLLGAAIPHIAVENPVGVISTRIRPCDQKIQPWMFGDDASKRTCLWLKGLPSLLPNHIIPPKGWWTVSRSTATPHATHRRMDGVEFASVEEPVPHPVWANQTPSGQNKLGPSADRWKERSKTYTGIAKAMAHQWGHLLS